MQYVVVTKTIATQQRNNTAEFSVQITVIIANQQVVAFHVRVHAGLYSVLTTRAKN